MDNKGLWIMKGMYIKGIAEGGKHNGGEGRRSHEGMIVTIIMCRLSRLQVQLITDG